MPVPPSARFSQLIRAPELFVITVLSAIAHFWRLFFPHAVVFDELHYKRFSGHYLDATHYFDGHPPLVKLLYGAVAKLAGVPANTMLGPQPVEVLRVVPAFMGTFFAPLAYVILRQLGAARQVAMLGAVAVLCENALLVDTRFALIEPFMIGIGLVAVVCFLASRRRDGAAHWILLAASGFAAGCAIASKWTGASALGLILAAWAYDAWRTRPSFVRFFSEGALLVAMAMSAYVGSFAVHYALIKKSGKDMALISPRFRSTLQGTYEYTPGAQMPLLDKLREVHESMRRGNIALELVEHPAASQWYTWPIMKHPIGFWEDNSVRGRKSMIALLGNPVVWWGSLIGVGLAAVMTLRRRGIPAAYRWGVVFLAGGFVINFAPFIAIRRVMYIYHYLFALVFVIMLAAYWGGTVAGWQSSSDDDRLFSFSSASSARWYWATFALIVVGFLYFLPFTYGWSLTQAAHDRRFWILHPF
jgi:dolichyl-phosphate-mannose-protein mannosyltransferase